MESLSPELLSRLLALGLCSSRDVRRCRARVRRLSRDLPAFDSVWLDALVQSGRLTRYQAEVCQDAGPDALVVGPYLLVDRQSGNGLWETFTARPTGAATIVQLTRLSVPEPQAEFVLQSLQRLREQLRSHPDSRVLAPLAVQRESNAIVIITPQTTGKSLAELLVRRGRFPVSVVWELLRGLAAALEHCERRGALHGDLRLCQVLLTPQGGLQLQQPGILAAAEPWINIHGRLPLDAFDGVAPELIDSRQERTIAGELYACGCLCWQLLAGRPPFAAGDPLLKLAAHQTRSLPDVRVWASETPADLAELLRRLTHRDPAARPANFSEVLRIVGRPSAGPSPRLRRFVRAFQSAAPRSLLPDEPRRRSGVRAAAVITGLLLATAAGWMQFGQAPQWRRIVAATTTSAAEGRVPEADSVAARAGSTALSSVTHGSATNPTPLPEPQQGEIRLIDAGPYAARSFSTAGPLTIRGPEGACAKVYATETWRLSATRVVLQNVSLVEAAENVAARPLLEVTAQDFGLVGCRLAAQNNVTTDAGDSAAAIVAWRSQSDGVGQPGRIGWHQTVILGDRNALVCQSPAASVQMHQVGYAGRGRLLHLPSHGGAQTVQVTLRQVTVRDAAAMVSLSAQVRERPQAVLSTFDRCAIAPAPNGAVIELRGTATTTELREALLAIRVGGVESWLQSDARLAVHRDGADSTAVDDEEMQVEGLQFASFRFPPEEKSTANSLRVIPPEGVTGTLPGCEVTQFTDGRGVTAGTAAAAIP